MIRQAIDSIAGRLGYVRSYAADISPVPLAARDVSWGWVQSPDFADDLAAYVYQEWISTAIDRVAELCVSVPLEVRSTDGMTAYPDHPLMKLLGPYGKPNPYQDSIEFIEAHFQRCDIFGNDVWYWASSNGGAPDSVWQLDPRRITVEVNAAGDVMYLYASAGDLIPLGHHQVTHFRRANVVQSGLHWGISAIQKLKSMIELDSAMVKWNLEFFKAGVPTGVLMVPPHTPPNEIRRIERDFKNRYGNERQMAVVTANPGNSVWNDAGAKQRDIEFEKGRLLTRQAAFDALGFHVGAVSEASTEAHARVSERMVRTSAYIRHMRSASKLNAVLRFWPGWDKYQVRFHDVRSVDWELEARKLDAVGPYMTVNEVRSRFLDLPAMQGYDYVQDKRKALKAGAADVEPEMIRRLQDER